MSSLTEALDLNFLRPSDIERIRATVKENPAELHSLNTTLRAHVRDFVLLRGSPSPKNAAEYDQLLVTLVKLSSAGIMNRAADGKFVIKVRDAQKNERVNFGDFVIALSKSDDPAVIGHKSKRTLGRKSGKIEDPAPKKNQIYLRNSIGKHFLKLKKLASLG